MAKNQEQTPVKRQFLFNPLKRPMPYIGLILGILIIIFQGTLRTYTANVVGTWLVSNLKSSTQGNYTLNYDFVRFDIFTKELRMQNFELKLDTTVISEEEYLQQYTNLVDLSTPVVVLKLRSLWDLIFNDKLLVAYIGVDKPMVNLIRSEALSDKEIEENQEQVTKQIRSYLQLIEIDSFRILNGALHVGLQDISRGELVDFRIADFSTLLKGFELNELRKNRSFGGIYIDEVELEVKDQEVLLPQLEHKLNFERLWLSSKDSIIQLDTVRIISTGKNIKHGSNLAVSELTLQSIDFKKSYEEGIMDIGRIVVSDPDLSISGLFKDRAAGEKIKIKGLQNLPFSEYNVSKFEITNGQLDLNLNHPIAIDKYNFSAENYHFDTLDLTMQKLVEGLDEFSLEASGLQFELPDSIHEINLQSVKLNKELELAVLNGISINPINDRRKYSLYKQQGVNRVTYGSIRQIILDGFDFSQAIENQQFLSDSLLIFNPRLRITEYPYISSRQIDGGIPYLVNHVYLRNGELKYNKRQYGRDNRSEFSGVNMEVQNFFPDMPGTFAFDNLSLQIANGWTEFKDIGHRLSFSKARSTDLRRFDIGSLHLVPDSTASPRNSYNVESTGLSIVAYDRDFLKNPKSIELEELSAQSFSANIDIRSDSTAIRSTGELENLVVNRFYFNNGDLFIRNDEGEYMFNSISTFVDSLHYSSTGMASEIPLNFHDLLVSHKEFKIDLKKDNFEISGLSGKYADTDSLLQFAGLSYNTSDQFSGSINNLQVMGFNRDKFLKYRGIDVGNLIVEGHEMIFNPDTTDRNGKLVIADTTVASALLDKFSSISIDSTIYRGGNLVFESSLATTRLQNINVQMTNYQLDSTSVADHEVFNPGQLTLNISSIERATETDTTFVNGVSADLIGHTIYTGRITAKSLNSDNALEFSAPGLTASGFSLDRLLRSDFSMDTVLIANANIQLMTTDTSSVSSSSQESALAKGIKDLFSKNADLTYDTLIRKDEEALNLENIELDSNKSVNFRKLLDRLKFGKEQEHAKVNIDNFDSLIKVVMVRKALATNGQIGYIGLENSKFEWLRNNQPHPYLGKINFSLGAKDLILDSLYQFSVYNHIGDLTLTVRNYMKTFSDSLNKFSFDTLLFSSSEDRIEIRGIALTPLVDKYQYDDLKGYQAGWHHLSGLNTKIQSIDIEKLIDKKLLSIRSVKIQNGTLDIFKEKELPIPVNLYRTMPQEAIKNIGLPFVIDSLSIDSLDVIYTSRLSSDMPEGTVSFHQVNGRANHLSNIDTMIVDHSKLNISASALVMGSGLLTAEFSFDMLNESNKFNFTGHLAPMDAKEFNSVLEATAYVSIESGDINDIKLQASGDEYYALGNMVFQYNNLKVSTINKRNLKTKGMGKVIRTFFANTFVVKKNNPALKFFPREGAMYFERDPQKVIFDYVAKTAMSGVVSSIGARNVRKDIKRIQNESRKQIEAEKKAKRKADRQNSIP